MLALPALAQEKRIVLGQSAAFSGPAAQLGIQMNKGARLYLDALNANGGVNGQQVELRTLDDGYEPDRCKANTDKFIKDDVFALLAYVGTPTCAAALPLVNEAKIPFFGPFTGAELLRDPFSRYVFHVRASYYQETAEVVKQLTTLGLNKIAVFYQNDSYGKAGLEGVTRALKQLNKTLSDELGKEGRGVVVSQVMPFPFAPITPISNEFLDAIGKSAGAVKPNYSSMEGYVVAKVFAEGLKRAGRNPSRDALINGLESIQNASFGGFKVNFGPRLHTASRFVDLSMLSEYGKVRR